VSAEEKAETIRVERAAGEVVEGEALVSVEGFSPRYDLDRWTGEISRPGHAIEGENIKDKVLFFPTAKGGIAAGWAFHDLKTKGIAPKALVFGVTNPVMVQGAVFAGITITEGWSPNPLEFVRTGDIVKVDPENKKVEVYRGKAMPD
jgi:predicted aconitase with swiveling domain